MKIIRVIFVVITILLFTAYVISMLDNLNNEKDILGFFPVYVVNETDSPFKLYSASNPKGSPISKLFPNEGFRYQYSGSSGAWLYGIKSSREVLVKNKLRSKSIYLNEKLINIEVFRLIVLVVFILFLIITSYLYAKNHGIKKFKRKEHEDKVGLLNLEVDRLDRENHQLRDNLAREKSLRESDRRNYQSDKARTTARHASELDNIQVKFDRYVDKEKEVVKIKFEEQERRLQDKFEQESTKRINVSISEMQSSLNLVQNEYDTLNRNYETIVNDGFTFDIDFKSDKYDGLLKGRKFEIYFAKQMLATPGYEILEWTSDKGFENGIPVKSNGNPDLIVSYRGGLEFAIECKYRGTYFIRDGKLISWAEKWQAERYNRFSEDRNIPVLIAIGFGENPSQPSKLICSSLGAMINASNTIEVSKKSTDRSNFQYMLDENSSDALSLNSYTEVVGMAANSTSPA